VEELEQRLPKDFTLIYDKRAMRPGDWISKFMREIGRADLVLVVLSSKYLRSAYCMRELLYLFQTSLGEREEFMGKIIPLKVGHVPISGALDRAKYVDYWEEKHDKLDKRLAPRPHTRVGDADRAELLCMKDFCHHTSNMLAWVADTLMPQGDKLHTEY
jgi:internalin A